jgi:hypothetical protein
MTEARLIMKTTIGICATTHRFWFVVKNAKAPESIRKFAKVGKKLRNCDPFAALVKIFRTF